MRYDVDNLRKELGIISKAVAQKMKESKGQDKCEEEKAQANAVKEKIELAEKQLRDGTATSQVISHYLKMGSSREKIAS